MTYKERLIKFNSTDKYLSEVSFVSNFLKKEEKVLDYGCGIGTAVRRFQIVTNSLVFGYDVQNYLEEPTAWFMESPPRDVYHHITFIHSLAHIENPFELLVKLRANLTVTGKISVITPNLDWINYVGDTKSDDTVIEHYTPKTLSNLFIGSGYTIKTLAQIGEYRGGFNERIFIQVEK